MDQKEPDADVVEKELERILGSKHFRSANRCRQFLTYVVNAKLTGRDDLLKERSIGTDIFQRDPDYATGDDPVVRVQASEVRKRLERFYHDFGQNEVRIELPIGSYSPNFVVAQQPVVEATVQKTHERMAPPSEPPRQSYWSLLLAALLGVTVSAAVFFFINFRKPTYPLTRSRAIQEFWAPVTTTNQPTLICLPKPIVYRPQIRFYDEYAKTHPETFQTQVDRLNRPIVLPPEISLRWGDLLMDDDLGLGAGDVQAAVRVASLLAKLDIPVQLRIGNDYSFGDLRNSPAVMIGGFSSRWTLKLTSNLKYRFAEKDGIGMIQETGSGGKSWSGTPDRDYGIVARLLSPETGQFSVVVAGITSNGSDAAAKFVSTEESIERAVGSLPATWPQHNLEVIVETEIHDGVPGPPHAVAVESW